MKTVDKNKRGEEIIENIVIGDNNQSQAGAQEYPNITIELLKLLEGKDAQINKVIALIEKKDEQIDKLLTIIEKLK